MTGAARILKFMTVGGIGTVVNISVMHFLMLADWFYLYASVAATEVAIVSNFLLQERFVFSVMKTKYSLFRRAAHAFVFNNVEQIVRLPVLILMVVYLGVQELLAVVITIGVAFVLRYVYMSKVVYTYRSEERINA